MTTSLAFSGAAWLSARSTCVCTLPADLVSDVRTYVHTYVVSVPGRSHVVSVPGRSSAYTLTFADLCYAERMDFLETLQDFPEVSRAEPFSHSPAG
jgi:hypothetical protein